jgi:hypothetical protein
VTGSRRRFPARPATRCPFPSINSGGNDRNKGEYGKTSGTQASSENGVGRFFADLGPGLITGAADFARYSLFQFDLSLKKWTHD